MISKLLKEHIKLIFVDIVIINKVNHDNNLFYIRYSLFFVIGVLFILTLVALNKNKKYGEIGGVPDYNKDIYEKIKNKIPFK